MNSFLKGMLFGVGIGLLIAPMKGEEMRRVIGERVGEFKGYLPENEQLSVYRQQVSDRLNQTAGSLKDYAQQASSTVKQAANNLSGVAQNAASTVKNTGQDVSGMTKDTVNKATNSKSM